MPNLPFALSRNQIAEIVNNDPQAIRAFENMLEQINVGIPEVIYPTVQSVDLSTSPYTISATDGNTVFLCDTSDGDIDIFLPTAVGNVAIYQIKKIDPANSVIIHCDGEEVIDEGLTATILVNYASITPMSDNSNWWIV